VQELIASWRESLTLLRPASLKMFGLLTLNAWIKAWKACWMYVVPLVAVILVEVQTGYFSGKIFVRPWVPLAQVAIIVLITVASSLFVAATRPSVAKKDGAYFFRILLNYIPIIVLLRLGIFFPKPMGMLWARLLVATMITPIMLFFTLFLFDTPAWSFKSYWRAIRNAVILFVFNLPLCLVAMVGQGVLCMPTVLLTAWSIALKHGALSELLDVASIFLFCLGISLMTCYWANLYTKRLYDQPNLYM
jgi:hypothetical protein